MSSFLTDIARFSNTVLENQESNKYKYDITVAEQIGFYFLLILNLTAIGMAGKNIYNGLKKQGENQIRTLIRLNALTIGVIMTRVTYELDVIPQSFGSQGLSNAVYVFFGVTSTILFGVLMLSCSYYWYKVAVLICLDTQNPPLKMSYAWRILIVMLVINFGFLLLNFIDKIVDGSLNSFTPLATSFISITNGVIFALSAILLHKYINSHTYIERRMKDVVKRARWIGFCAIFRCIVDITFYLEFSSNWKDSSEKEGGGVSWAIFIFIYFIVSDIVPTFLFIEQFAIETDYNQIRAHSFSGSEINEELITRFSLTSPVGDKITSEKPIPEEKSCEAVLKHVGLLSASGVVPGSNLVNLEVVALLFAGNWCPPCREFCVKLKEVYQEINQFRQRLEIVFVSGDYDDKAFKDYFSSMPWLAIPYEDPLREHLIDELEIGSIPELYILGKNGLIISRKGKIDIEKMGIRAFDKWVAIIS